MSSFFDLGLASHLGKDNQLIKLSNLLNWNCFTRLLKDVHKEDGRTGYDTLKMFKCLLLGQWHSLSDPALEQSLRVRLDFLQFTGFSLGDSLPDETTFCRFRNKLVAQGKMESLLNEVNQQLEKSGLKVKSANTAIVDATIIESAARPRTTIVNEDAQAPQVEYSADLDARWLKKGKKSYFGYRLFTRCDKEGFIDKTHAKPANASETKELENAVSRLKKRTRVLADKGFCSAENRVMLKEKGLKDGIMHKATRNNPLSKKNSRLNKVISKTRWRIEQCFGTIKRRFGYEKASYFSTLKVEAQFTLKAICLNLLKAINKLEMV